MRYLRKALGATLLAAMMAILAGAGVAGATVLTSPAGTKVEAKTVITAEAESSIGMDITNFTPDVGCSKSTLKAEVTNAGSATTTVSGPVTSLSFNECGGTDTVTVISNGSIELHWTSGSDGILKSTGAEITVQVHRTVLGAPVTTHCIWRTNGTTIGTFLGSATTKGTATLEMGSAEVERVATDGACQEKEYLLTGNYKITSPDYLDADEKPIEPGTTLTSRTGSTTLGAGEKIKAESAGAIEWDGTFPLSCENSALEAEVGNAGGAGSTVTAPISSLTFTECGTDTVTVLKKGTLELHATGAGNATATWSGAEFTTLVHKTLMGFPVTAHCITKTEATHIGTFTGTNTTDETAVLDLGKATLQKVATDTACGEAEVALTGSYKFTSPDLLEADVAASSGTTLTSLTNTTVEAGAKVKAESEGAIEFAGTITFNCQKSVMEGEISSVGKEIPATVSLSSLSFSECGNHTIEVKKPGTLEIEGVGGGKGTLRSSGAEITILTHGVFLGTRHCIYVTEKTDIGTITGSSLTKGTATLDIGPVTTSQSATDGTCGSNAQWGGSYQVTSPDHLNVDQT